MFKSLINISTISFRELLEGAEIESLDINSIETMDELDDFCKKYNLYNF